MLKPLEKEMSKEMYFGGGFFVFFVSEFTFGEVEMNCYHIVRVLTLSKVVKLKK